MIGVGGAELVVAVAIVIVAEDVDDLASQMIEVLGNNQLSASMVARGAEYAAHNSWGERKADYFALVDSLCQ